MVANQQVQMLQGINMKRKNRPETPDGRYFVAKGHLQRCTNPSLSDTVRRASIKTLMQARHAAMKAKTPQAAQEARACVAAAKTALGERGPVWWSDGAPDEGRQAPENSSYASWWAALSEDEREAGR